MDDIKGLIDKTLTGIANRNTEIVFEVLGDRSLKLNQSGRFSIMSGDLNDVIGAPILNAEETTEHEGRGKIYTVVTIKGSAIILSPI